MVLSFQTASGFCYCLGGHVSAALVDPLGIEVTGVASVLLPRVAYLLGMKSMVNPQTGDSQCNSGK